MPPRAIHELKSFPSWQHNATDVSCGHQGISDVGGDSQSDSRPAAMYSPLQPPRTQSQTNYTLVRSTKFFAQMETPGPVYLEGYMCSLRGKRREESMGPRKASIVMVTVTTFHGSTER